MGHAPRLHVDTLIDGEIVGKCADGTRQISVFIDGADDVARGGPVVVAEFLVGKLMLKGLEQGLVGISSHRLHIVGLTAVGGRRIFGSETVHGGSRRLSRTALLVRFEIVGYVVGIGEVGPLNVGGRLREVVAVFGGECRTQILLLRVVGFQSRHFGKRTRHLILHFGCSHLEHAHILHLQRREPLLQLQRSVESLRMSVHPDFS